MSRSLSWGETLSYTDNHDRILSDALMYVGAQFEDLPRNVRQGIIDRFITLQKNATDNEEETRRQWREKYGEDEQ